MAAIESFPFESWRGYLEFVLTQPAHSDVIIPKLDVPHPTTVGFISHLGDPAGQKDNFRLPLSDGREVHLKEYDRDYLAHWDHKSAILDPIGHLINDAFHWFVFLVIGAVAVAFLVGLWIWIRMKRSNQAALQ